MKRPRLFAAAIAVGALAVIAGGGAALAASSSSSGFQAQACVTFGKAGSAAGNYMLFDWNDSACPPGTYLVHLANYPDVDPTVTVTATPSASASSSASATSSATSTSTAAG